MINEDAQAKKDGYIVKYSFWVHPKSGDDFCTDLYRSKKLTKKEKQAYINYIKNMYNSDLVEEPIIKDL